MSHRFGLFLEKLLSDLSFSIRYADLGGPRYLRRNTVRSGNSFDVFFLILFFCIKISIDLRQHIFDGLFDVVEKEEFAIGIEKQVFVAYCLFGIAAFWESEMIDRMIDIVGAIEHLAVNGGQEAMPVE